jgi:hypothetical protein
MYIELNASNPAAPSGAQNVHFRADSTHLGTSTDPEPVSAYLLPFTGDSGSGGASGLVPAPAAGDAAAGKVLKADGTWYIPPGDMTNPMSAEGDLIYGGTSGAATRLAAGTAGQILQTNGSGSAPSWVTSSSGNSSSSGISLFSTIAGLAPTLTGTGLSTAYNQQSSFSAVDSTAGIVLNDVAYSGDHWEGIVRAYPTPPFTLTAVLGTNSDLSYQFAGVVIAASLVGSLIAIGVIGNGGPYRTIVTYSAPSTYVSNLVKDAISSGILGIKIIDDGSTLTVKFSSDGWLWHSAYSVAKSASYLGSSGFNYLGFGLDPQNYATSATLLAWNIT